MAAWDENPAEIISRGTSAAELIKAITWWNGPRWLEEDKSSWQPQSTLNVEVEELPEIRKMKLALIVTNPVVHMVKQYSE